MIKMSEQSYYTIIGSFSDVLLGIGLSIVRQPWPHFDVTGSQIIFGDHVVISSGVYIHTHNHHFDKINWRELPIMKSNKPTEIESYSFLGTNCQIMPSCKRIGKHSVIAAGSIVTKNVPDYEIWAGNPAVKIGCVK